MNKIIECKLNIIRKFGDKEETSTIVGKGYYKKDEKETTIFFSSDDFKYKYIISDEQVTIFCNDSKYIFISNKKGVGEIKSGAYIFKVTTFVSYINIKDNFIEIDYSLYQDKELIGEYSSSLSFN